MKKGLFVFFLALAACSTHQATQGTAIDDMNVALHQGIAGNEAFYKSEKNRPPDRITKALVPGIKIRAPQKNHVQRRFDISVKNVPARTFFTGLVTGTPLSIAVSPEIQGEITLNLKQVTVEQVLQTVEDVYGYAYNPIPGGYEILPNSLKTEIYAVNYLELERKGRSNMRLNSGEVTQIAGTRNTNTLLASSTTTATNPTNIESTIGDVETKSTIDFWKQMQATLQSIIGTEDGRSVTVNPLAGVVVVRAKPREHKQVEAYLDLVQNSMDRQVILEAKILEVTLNDQYQMGIDWKIFGARLNALSDFVGTGVDINQDEFPDAFKIDIKWNQSFQTTIQALETQGNVQVLSSPRVATMNNQMSAIKVGSDEFFVTNVNTTQNFATAGGVTNPTQNVDLTPFFSGITLDVTPQIDANNNVTLHIHPSVSLVRDQRKRIDLGAQGGVLELPLAFSTIRESDTIVHAKNGQVVVIGGLMQNQTEEDIAQMPFFGNIPFLGTLFRATKQNSRKSELVILLRPIVMNPKNINRDLIESTQQFARIKRGYHFGSRPDIFGTEGEEPVSVGPKAGVYTPSQCRGGRCT
ncbi:pilus (MSHA type) biogenesis protein MshL [Legionella oakridgensis]|uniref:Type II protein secretion LspD n=1 Tax=Legionella oakridgensis TaxID=29423 RepID=A0A0W0X380_9GAMM|nr:pilus (MSHA type) biogenesis protein MshL [Legionella oakridgensis]ETO92187.1 pilus (MSHA type) biogenesis protein MshL [Legionella oakridgensis RV-2-2007]KTD38952.1 type II protein secretion LspD [Legionella oakridgensis]STY21320.1 type II protein secretion LspD [Legionella longbeachae]